MKKSANLFASFGHAFDGFLHCIKHERNIRIHLCMGILALLLGFVFEISHGEFLVLFLLIGAVIISEMMNTAIENLVDLVTEEFHPLAKIIKDITAGAVLFSCLIAVCIGLMIFIPHILALL